MFVTFHLSISFVVDADLRSVWGLLPGFGSHCTVRDLRMFWKIADWTQSATDDPGFCSFFHETSGFSTNEGVYPPVYSEYVEGSLSLLMLMCV